MSKAFKLVKKVVGSPIGKIGLGLLAPYAAPALGITSALGTAALGAGIGGATGALSGGGLKGALLGAAGGGFGSYLGAGGKFGLGSSAAGSGSPFTAAGFSNITNSATKAALSPLATSGGSLGGTLSSYGSTLKNVLSGGLGINANSKAEDQLIEAQRKALAAYKPYMNQTYTPEDLASDPGYQFRLSQGNQALDRQQSAKGNYFSGQALKDATTFSQNLAAEENQNAFSRWLAQQQQGANVAGAAADIYGNIGNTKANATIGNSNLFSRGLSGILGGSGFNNQGQSFDPSSLTYEQLKQLGLI